jgi:hypothetical protein
MKKVYTIATIFCVFAIGAKPFDQFPQAEITNGLIHARIYLPDTANGYYRGSRFDWSAVMPDLEYKGHTFFGQWYNKYSPTQHDAIMGPVEDFYPVGYDEAKVDESFLKIGIGMVAKPEEQKYFFVTPYKLINSGSWKIKKKSDEVEFIHKLEDKQYAYEYKKTVQLLKGKPGMVLSHTLKNTGKKDIITTVYNHNFFVMDKQPTGKDFAVEFPFNLSGEPRTKDEVGKIEGNKIIFLKELSDKEQFSYASLQGYGTSPKDYDIKIENHKTGAAVRITSDQPISKLVFWCAPKTLCPEPYIQINIKPGDTFNWKIFYQFYICDINQN